MSTQNSAQTGTRPAFSLLEVLIALGLFALLTASVVVSLGPLFGGELERDSLEDKLREAVREARYQAGVSREPVELTWDQEAALFRIRARTGLEPLDEIKTPYRGEDIRVTFYRETPSQGLPGRSFRPISEEVTSAIFSPDRSSTPLEVEIQIGAESQRYRFDLFSSAEIQDNE